MTPVERQMLTGLFDRVASTAATTRDPEADAFIASAMQAQPHAPYVLSQTVLVQQQALENAARRVQELEAQVKAQAPHEETSFLGNLGKSLFGSGAPAAAPPRGNYDASAYARQPGQAASPAYAPQHILRMLAGGVGRGLVEIVDRLAADAGVHAAAEQAHRVAAKQAAEGVGEHHAAGDAGRCGQGAL